MPDPTLQPNSDSPDPARHPQVSTSRQEGDGSQHSSGIGNILHTPSPKAALCAQLFEKLGHKPLMIGEIFSFENEIGCFQTLPFLDIEEVNGEKVLAIRLYYDYGVFSNPWYVIQSDNLTAGIRVVNVIPFLRGELSELIEHCLTAANGEFSSDMRDSALQQLGGNSDAIDMLSGQLTGVDDVFREAYTRGVHMSSKLLLREVCYGGLTRTPTIENLAFDPMLGAREPTSNFDKVVHAVKDGFWGAITNVPKFLFRNWRSAETAQRVGEYAGLIKKMQPDSFSKLSRESAAAGSREAAEALEAVAQTISAANDFDVGTFVSGVRAIRDCYKKLNKAAQIARNHYRMHHADPDSGADSAHSRRYEQLTSVCIEFNRLIRVGMPGVYQEYPLVIFDR